MPDQMMTWIGMASVMVATPMLLGFIFGVVHERERWRKGLVKRGHAQYNWMNAKWEWKDGEKLKGPPNEIA